MRNFIQTGDVITVVVAAAVIGGAGLLAGSLFGVVAVSAPAGAEAEIKTTGVFDLKADAAATGAVGAKAYWDDTAKQVTATVGGNKLIGMFIVEKVATQATARVRLNGISV